MAIQETQNGAQNGLHEANGKSPGPLDWSYFKNTINGALESTSESRHAINPATGENGPEVPVATKKDVEKAMAAAQAAFKTWSAVAYSERQKAVLAFADALEAEKEKFIQMLTQEQGKPVSLPLYPIVKSQRNEPF